MTMSLPRVYVEPERDLSACLDGGVVDLASRRAVDSEAESEEVLVALLAALKVRDDQAQRRAPRASASGWVAQGRILDMAGA